ncbi:hypothetical protein Tco_0839865 [Tanacetum coccineum]|uniref:FBD domain-containing protein n=1 Tax=Tanacetum coccineum TaxID=301880 RepID=A0ABQ5AVY4_9ASTR
MARNNNTLKKFTLDLHPLHEDCRYQLPRSIFSLHHLMDLNIIWCDFDFGSISNGFGSLTSLYLTAVSIYKKALLRLLSSYPSLKCFELVQMIDPTEVDEVTNIELLICLPMIEHLSFYGWIDQHFTQNSNPKELPNALVHLKYFLLEEMMFFDEYGLDFLCLVMRSSPNLKKIKLQVNIEYPEDFEVPENSMIKSVSLESCSNIWLEHLEELDIREFSTVLCVMEFMKLILAKYPVLKKVHLVLESSVTKDKDLEISRILTSFPRVSPLAEIIVKSRFSRRGVNICLASAIQLS